MGKAARLAWRGLTPHIFAFFVVPLAALVLLLSFGGLYLHRQAMRGLVAERDERAARAAAAALAEQARRRASAVQTLARRATPGASPQALSALLADLDFLLPDFDGGLAFYAPEGRLLAWSGEKSLWEGLDPASDPALASFFARSDPARFLSYARPPAGEIAVLVAAPASEDGPIAVGAFSPGMLARQELDSVFAPAGETSALLVDSQGRLLYGLGNAPGGAPPADHPGVAEALRGESGATYLQAGGDEHVVAYSPVPPLGWALVIEEPWEALASPLLRATENAPLALLPALLLALVALWYAARWIVQPLQALETRAARLGWGDFAAIEKPVGGIAEIRRLQSELVHLAHKVRASQEGLRGYIGAITAGQEEERRRLARELHDDTLQALIALHQRIQLVHLSLNGDVAEEPASAAASRPPAEALAEIQALAEQTIHNLRRVTGALRPVYLDELGLSAALEMLARQTSQASGLPVEFRQAGQERRLPADSELALYRIAQEALSNAVRHARAGSARLHLEYGPEAVRLEIADDGRGFSVPESPAEFARRGHFGLLGMHERAELIGAHLGVRSSPGQGTRLSVSLDQ